MATAQEKQGFGAPLLALERCFSLPAPLCPSLPAYPGLKKTPGQNKLAASGLLLHLASGLPRLKTSGESKSVPAGANPDKQLKCLIYVLVPKSFIQNAPAQLLP